MAKGNSLQAELEVLYSALQSAQGLVVATEDPKLALAKLYRARNEAQDPALAGLAFRRSPFNVDGEIMIIRLQPQGKSDG